MLIWAINDLASTVRWRKGTLHCLLAWNDVTETAYTSQMDIVPNLDYSYVAIFAQKSHNTLTKLLDFFLFYPCTDTLKAPNNVIEFLLNKRKVRLIWIYFYYKSVFTTSLTFYFSLSLCKCWIRTDNIMLAVKLEHFSPCSRRNGYITYMRTINGDIINCFIWYLKGFIHRDLQNMQFRK